MRDTKKYPILDETGKQIGYWKQMLTKGMFFAQECYITKEGNMCFPPRTFCLHSKSKDDAIAKIYKANEYRKKDYFNSIYKLGNFLS
jgi:hypothetical protein